MYQTRERPKDGKRSEAINNSRKLIFTKPVDNLKPYRALEPCSGWRHSVYNCNYVTDVDRIVRDVDRYVDREDLTAAHIHRDPARRGEYLPMDVAYATNYGHPIQPTTTSSYYLNFQPMRTGRLTKNVIIRSILKFIW